MMRILILIGIIFGWGSFATAQDITQGTQIVYFKNNDLKSKKDEQMNLFARSFYRVNEQKNTLALSSFAALKLLYNDKKVSMKVIAPNANFIITNKQIQLSLTDALNNAVKDKKRFLFEEITNDIGLLLDRDFKEKYNFDTYTVLVDSSNEKNYHVQLQNYLYTLINPLNKKDTLFYTKKYNSYKRVFDSKWKRGAQKYASAQNNPVKFFKKGTKMPFKFLEFYLGGSPENNLVFSDSMQIEIYRKKTKFIRLNFVKMPIKYMEDLPVANKAFCYNGALDVVFAEQNIVKFPRCESIVGRACDAVYYPIFNEMQTFKIPFEQNSYEDFKNALKPIEKYLSQNNLEIKMAEIKSYASVEGDTANNLALAQKRAELLINLLKEINIDIEAVVYTQENWKSFFDDLPKTPFVNWNKSDTAALRKLINDSSNVQVLEKWLKSHRYAEIKVIAQKKISPKERLALIYKDYEKYVYLYNHPRNEQHQNLSSQKLASIRKYIIGEVLKGKLVQKEALPFFTIWDDDLVMANYYQQLPLLMKKNFTLAMNADSFIVKSFNAGKIKYYYNTAKITSDVRMKKKWEEASNNAKSFLFTVMRTTLVLIDKGLVDKHILDRLTFPEGIDFVLMQNTLEFAKNGLEINKSGKHGSSLFVTQEIDSSLYTFTDYQLQFSGNSIFSKEHVNYKNFKAYLFDNTLKLSEDEIAIRNQFVLVFLENQLAGFDKKALVYYDEDFDFNKIKTVYDLFNKEKMCQTQVDRMYLSLYNYQLKKLYASEEYVKSFSEIANIVKYYKEHADYLTDEMLLDLVKVLVKYEQKDEVNNKHINYAYNLIRIKNLKENNNELLLELHNTLEKMIKVVTVK